MRHLQTHQSHLHGLIEDVRAGRLTRRGFVVHTGRIGLSLPMAGMLLLHAGVASSQPAPAYKPTRQGGGGVLRFLQAEGPTLLNPHFASGMKDVFACRIFHEPLVQWDADANLQPILAAETPTRDNGGLAADGKSVLWRLKRDVRWHDGAPFTADDVMFNWQYATDRAGATVSAGSYANLRMEKVDSHTVRVVFDRSSPFWPGQYAGILLIAQHVFKAYTGARSREAPANLKPVGTGAYVHVDFTPGDRLVAALNPNYHMALRPHFDRLELKGGGDSMSAARAVLQTGDYDYAGSVLVEDELLKGLEARSKGRVVFLPASATTAIYLNVSDPHTELDGERAHRNSRHPLFSDPVVRQALGLLVDRKNMQDFVFGRQGVATANFINQPERLRSPNTRWSFDVDKAARLLDDAGWKPGADGVRAKGGRRLAVQFQAATNTITQKVQQMVKQSAQRAGIEIELKVVTPAVFFSSDAGNPDTSGRFQADMQMYNWTSAIPDPETLMQPFVSWEVASKANQWMGKNSVRWQNAEFDALFRAAQTEADPVKRAAQFIRMNDLLVGDGHVIPVIARNSARAVGRGIVTTFSGWHVDTAHLHDWYRES